MIKKESSERAARIKKIPIEEIIACYVPLRRQGRTYVGRCPFHNDTDPSFVVWPGSGGRWYCFGACSNGGDVISFIQKLMNMSFTEACDFLEGREGKVADFPTPTLPRQVYSHSPSPGEQQALNVALRIYHTRLWLLPPDHTVRVYIARRQITPDTIRRFAIGWASGTELVPALNFVRCSLESAMNAGLVTSAGREFFRARLIFPDLSDNNVQYMVGRSLAGEPRYLGLPGLPKPLWGLGTAMRQLPLLVTEGVFCRLSLEQCGRQAVAVMGTALKENHIQALRMFPDLVFIPQNDEAGQQAVRRWLESIGHGRIAQLPAGFKDVNEFHEKAGEGQLREWLKKEVG